MYMTVKDLFLTRKLRDLRMIAIFILFAQPMVSSTSIRTFKNFSDKLPIKPKLGEVFMNASIHMDEQECIEVGLSNFSDNNANVVAFGKVNGECYVFSLSGLDKIFINADFRMNSTLRDTNGWTTYVPKLKLFTERVVFWPLSRTTIGRNFGSAGFFMDLHTSCHFSLEGGPGNTSARFCEVQFGTRAEVPLMFGDVHLFNFTKAFTIALWVKAWFCDHGDSGNCMLVGSTPNFGPRFAIWPSAYQVVLAFGRSRNSMAISTRNTRGYPNWRHLAVVYKPPRDVTFYLNGEHWPVLKRITDLSRNVTAENLLMFQSPTGEMSFVGQMACVTIHNVALSKSQIWYIKDFCP